MADRPILFSAPMIRAIKDGRKTMTRRVLKPQPKFGFKPWLDEDAGQWMQSGYGEAGDDFLKVPYAPGDFLWVREAWRTYGVFEDTPPRDLWKPGGDRGAAVFYDADGGNLGLSRTGERFCGERGTANRSSFGKLRPGMFMPRWASRITLRVTGVKVERLQDISEKDAVAEGIEGNPVEAWRCYAPEPKQQTHWADPRESFRTLWESINGPGSWGANPWVAAYTFEPIFCNIDEVKA